MMKTTLTALLLSVSAGALAAQEAEVIPQTKVSYQNAYDGFWDGAYAGFQLGYVYGEFDLSLDPGDLNDDSFIGGVTLGYLWNIAPGWYLGPEFQYDWADVTVTDSNGNTGSFEEIARLKLVAGYELGNGMLYGSLGYAYASFDGVGNFFDGDESSYVIGIGYDWRLNDNWTLGGEYLFQSFDDVGSAGNDVDLNSLYLKATYRF